MNYILIFLFAIALSGCSLKENKTLLEKSDIEMDVINDVLPFLIPKESRCVLAPIEGETNEDYEKRSQESRERFLNATKTIEIITFLTEQDSSYVQRLRPFEKGSVLELLFNAPKKKRRLDSTMIHKIEGLEIILAKEQWNIGGPDSLDCNTLGQFNISRVGFNSDSTKAAFNYYVYNGSCTVRDGGIIEAELKNGKWRIIK